MSHTPGPWKFEVVDETDSFLGCKRLDGGGGSTVIDLSNEWTGYPECGQDLQMTISKEDAALIESAPEMYIALQNVRVELDSYPHCPFCGSVHGEGHEKDCIGYEVESAIRKARGEECD